jgi:hypothetical protein
MNGISKYLYFDIYNERGKLLLPSFILLITNQIFIKIFDM